jgi:hypothetical protein
MICVIVFGLNSFPSSIGLKPQACIGTISTLLISVVFGPRILNTLYFLLPLSPVSFDYKLVS